MGGGRCGIGVEGEGPSTLGGRLRFFHFPKSTPKLSQPMGSFGGGDWVYLESFPASRRQTQSSQAKLLIMWFFKRKESRVSFGLLLSGGSLTSAGVPAPSQS